jgi:hypothetical protein
MLLYIDGELNILKEVLGETVMAAFQKAGINLAKGPPSATHCHQAWDCGPLFRGIKMGVERIINAHTPFENQTLQRNLEEYLVDFDTAFPSVKLASAFREKIMDCLQTICWSAKANWTSPKMTDSFVCVGQHVLGITAAGAPTVNYSKIMSRSYSVNVTQEELDYMYNMLETVAQKYRLEGTHVLFTSIFSLSNLILALIVRTQAVSPTRTWTPSASPALLRQRTATCWCCLNETCRSSHTRTPSRT